MTQLRAGWYKAILSRLRKNARSITPEERLWIQTNPGYDETYGYPYLAFDIIEIPTGKARFTVRLIEKNTRREVRPVFLPAARKGYFVYDGLVKDIDGNIKHVDKIKVLSPSFDTDHNACSFDCRSQYGKVELYYDCDVSETGLFARMMPSTITPYLLMLKTKVDDHTVRYSCTTEEDRRFGDYVFEVTWEALDTKVTAQGRRKSQGAQ